MIQAIILYLIYQNQYIQKYIQQYNGNIAHISGESGDK
jgi:hypothetical protein